MSEKEIDRTKEAPRDVASPGDDTSMEGRARPIATAIASIPGKGRGVVALRDFSPGEVVMVGKPVQLVSERTAYSIQTGWNKHANFDEPAILSNHSCDPTCGIRDNGWGGYDFIALRPIRCGEEVTWDYCMSEYISIAVDSCLCGSPACRSRPTGYRFLPEEVRRRYRGFCAGYLDT